MGFGNSMIAGSFFSGISGAYAGAGAISTVAASSGAFAFATAGAASGFAAGTSAAAFSGANFGEAISAGAKGAASGALFGGVAGAYGNDWSWSRVGANGLAGGVSAEINGGDFEDGFKLSLSTSLLEWSALSMRNRMVAQSRFDPRNASGESVGFKRDGFKLAGGRFNVGQKGKPCSILGCDQGGEGKWGLPFFKKRFAYASGSWQDHLFEAYAGPHDSLNSGFWYNAQGNINQVNAFGNIVGQTLNAVNVFVATPFVVASVMPHHVTSQLVFTER